MPRRCLFGCEPNDVPLHRFPNAKKFPDILKAWVSLVGGKLESTADYEYYKEKRICDIHFTNMDRTGTNRLYKEAIPSLNIPGLLAEQTILNQPSTSEQHSQHVQSSLTEQLEGLVNLEHAQPPTPTCTSFEKPVVKDVLLEHNYSFTNRPRNVKPRPGYNIVQPLRAKIRQLRSTISHLRKKGQTFQTRLQNVETMCNNATFNHVIKNMTKPAQLFAHMQLQATKKAKGRRFSDDEKILSLSLYKKSPKCYALLSKYFTLPSSKAMKRLLSKVKIATGINPVIFEKIRQTVADLPPSDRLCSLMFDEMSLAPQILYNIHEDSLEGFATNNESTFANHVLVFMIKGIRRNFKQPVAYYFTNGLNKMQLKNFIITIIKKLQEVGLIILNTVCDQSTVNIGAIKELINDTKRLCLKNGKEWRHDMFRINGKSIVPLYDAPHLIKGIRNNLLNKDMIYNIENEEKIVKWEYYQKVYAADKSLGELRLLHKITEEHIIPDKINKMKVKSATQIFSHSVAVATEHLAARGEVPEECKSLIKITLLLDNLFDSLNVSTLSIPNGKIYKGPIRIRSPHHKLWQNAKIVLKSIKFRQLKKTGNKIQLIEITIPSVQNLIKTIEGMEAIWKILNGKYGFDAFLTRNFNQDPVENFFGNIRSYGARNNMPNSVCFEGAYKALLLNNYSSPHSNRANCEEDANKCLQNLKFFLTEEISNTECTNVPNEDICINENVFTQQKETDAGQRNYVCGWVLTKCLKNVVKSCKECRQDLIDSGTNQNNAFIARKEYNNKKWLCYPSKDLENCFAELQNIIISFLEKNVPKKGIKFNITNMADCLIKYPFKCSTHKDILKIYLVNTTINIIICSWCRSVNRILAGKMFYNGEDETKMSAQLYYNKYKHYKNKK